VARIERREGAPRTTKQALTEAWWWLVRKGLTAPDAQERETPGGSLPALVARSSSARTVSRGSGPVSGSTSTFIRGLQTTCASEFLRGKFETAVFTAIREVEIAVREKSGADDDSYGQGLLGHAFGKGGALIDTASADAEEQAVANVFRGAIGAFKTPPSHRRVDFDDPTEAAEIVLLASLLLRILDRLGDH
jgi:uncharacterized protein (TIGR02391 family)